VATFEKRIGTSGKTTWRVRVRRRNGPFLTKSFAKKSDGETWARSIESRIDAGEQLPNSEARKRTLADAINRYLEVTLPHAKHKKNASEQIRQLTWWRDELGSTALANIKTSTVAEARDKLAKRRGDEGEKVSGATLNRYLSALSSVLTVTHKEYGWIVRNPVENVRRFADSKSRERFLSDSERDAVLAACDKSAFPPLATIVRFALATGARRGEILALQWSSVDLQNRTARFLDTKNGESRTVPLAKPAIEILKTWKRDRLPTGNVFPVSKDTLHKYWRIAVDDSKVKNFRFHDLRHSAASYLAMSGASLMDIAAILGHKTLAMVKRYSHLSEQHTTAAIDRMAEKFLKNSG
jgi:integrase